MSGERSNSRSSHKNTQETLKCLWYLCAKFMVFFSPNQVNGFFLYFFIQLTNKKKSNIENFNKKYQKWKKKTSKNFSIYFVVNFIFLFRYGVSFFLKPSYIFFPAPVMTEKMRKNILFWLYENPILEYWSRYAISKFNVILILIVPT